MLMKKNHLLATMKLCLLALGSSTLLFTSCAKDGYDNDEKFESSVTNTQLASPDADKISITPSPDGTTMTIEWPIVIGAGGYQITLTDVSDAENPVVIASQVVDGCSVAGLPRGEDMYYQLELKTLGNASKGNTDAPTATVKAFSTATETTGTIPTGNDLAKWFAANPIPDSDDMLYYDLVAGGTYTLNSMLDFQGHKVTLRCKSKTNRAVVTYGEDGGLACGNAFGLRYLIFECANSSKPFFSLSTTPGMEADAEHNNHYIITEPITFAYCEMRNVNSYFVYDNKKKYCVATFLVNECVVKMSSDESMKTGAAFQCYDGGGFICNLTLQNSTFWNSNSNKQNYFIRYANAGRADRAGFTSSSINMINCTFYNIAKQGQMCNHSGFDGDKYTNYTITKNIFVDCGSNQVARRILGRRGTGVIVFNLNTYMFDGAVGTDQTGYDDGSILTTDPGFADAPNGDFTISGEEQLANQTGDPRWINNN